MAVIIAPNEKYDGTSCTVKFRDGKGETDKQHLIEWFKEHGYTVEDKTTKKPKAANIVEDETTKNLKATDKE